MTQLAITMITGRDRGHTAEAPLDLLVEVLRAPADRRRPVAETLRALGAYPPDALLALLRANDLDRLWGRRVDELGLASRLPAGLAAPLAEARRLTVAQQLRLDIDLRRVEAALEAANIPHVLFKGAHLCRAAYAEPSDRPYTDIDVLVPPDLRAEAVRALCGAGFVPRYRASRASHEVPFRAPGGWIDLHWRLFRPGRARRAFASAVVADRVRSPAGWVPSDQWTLVILLLHPALTDHVTGRLIRAVDLDRWVRLRPPPWRDVVAIVSDLGLRAAAWATIEWTCHHLAAPIPAWVRDALSPPPLRAAYLRAWLRADPAARYETHPLTVRTAFSLALQDRARDRVRAAAELGLAYVDGFRLGRRLFRPAG